MCKTENRCARRVFLSQTSKHYGTTFLLLVARAQGPSNGEQWDNLSQTAKFGILRNRATKLKKLKINKIS